MRPDGSRGWSRRPVRILALAESSASLPEEVPGDPAVLDVDFAVVCGHSDDTDRPYAVEPLPARHPGGPRWRVAGAWGRTQWLAARRHAPPRWLWQLKRSAWLRHRSREVDLVISLDDPTDAALTAEPGLLPGAVLSADSERIWSALADFSSVITDLRRATEQPADHDHGDLTDRTTRWSEQVQGLTHTSVPGCLSPLEQTAEIARELRPSFGPQAAAEIIRLLDSPPWPVRERARSGLWAQRASADLWLAPTSTERPPEADLREAADAALAGADEALVAGLGDRALGRHWDALDLIFHRERHAEVEHSALVDDPQQFLGTLWSSSVQQTLVQSSRRGARPPAPTARQPGGRARVAVLTGAYGQFHDPVATALSTVADVRVLSLVNKPYGAWRRFADPAILSSLAHLRATDPQELFPGLRGPGPLDLKVARSVRKIMSAYDVVFSDWADRATVWASHCKPQGVRLASRS